MARLRGSMKSLEKASTETIKIASDWIHSLETQLAESEREVRRLRRDQIDFAVWLFKTNQVTGKPRKNIYDLFRKYSKSKKEETQNKEA